MSVSVCTVSRMQIVVIAHAGCECPICDRLSPSCVFGIAPSTRPGYEWQVDGNLNFNSARPSHPEKTLDKPSNRLGNEWRNGREPLIVNAPMWPIVSQARGTQVSRSATAPQLASDRSARSGGRNWHRPIGASYVSVLVAARVLELSPSDLSPLARPRAHKLLSTTCEHTFS
jgi:hypothetical protein